MNAKDTAGAFVALLKAGDHVGAAEKFNAPNIVSIEAMEGPMERVTGKAAVKGKSDWWYANHDVHKVTSDGPFMNGDQFAVLFDVDVTPKDTGQRVRMQEIGVYTVRDGQIVEERFYY